MRVNEPLNIDVEKAKNTIEKGRRAKWWQRLGKSVRSFRYIDATGQKIVDPAALDRIRQLVIPPAWTFVRVNPSATGKIQCVGMDSTGRIQYRYHPVFAKRQQKKKFAKVEDFGRALPKLRQVTNRHISLEGLTQEKVLAVSMRLINSLYFRVGTDLSVKRYKTYGLTTLRKRHLKVGRKGKLIFEFVGKSHVQHRKVIVDQELAAIVSELWSLRGGQKLFRSVTQDGKINPITPAQINSYLKTAMGPTFSSKDFRTWGGSVLAAVMLAELGPAENETMVKKNIAAIVKKVAAQLGNTPAVCRAAYIHPTVLDAYTSGTTISDFTAKKLRRISRISTDPEPEEKALLKLFESFRKI